MSNVNIAVTIAPENTIADDLFKDIEFYQDSIDIIELRVDQWDKLDRLNQVIEELNQLTFDFKILITFRSASQGGKRNVNESEYLNVIEHLINTDGYNMLDIEWDGQKNKDDYLNLINLAQQKGLEVVLSHHNFDETPTFEEMKFTYYKMSQFNSNYIKLAVMPHDIKDVLHLLEAMNESANTLNQKVIGISMSKIGVISRTAQGVFGGVVSYGCLGEPQAPGQIHVEELKKQIDFYEK
ncbi:type I 3-dehydroquinate dehydratase [Staphylococcus pasteuri]|uniref:type I 3-dehydroquinate dehydratase n=1 Tax=Staphylococcus pasteuri TaxID=45972 RepID=UPI00379A1C87